jgi:hypothetical protein
MSSSTVAKDPAATAIIAANRIPNITTFFIVPNMGIVLYKIRI